MCELLQKKVDQMPNNTRAGAKRKQERKYAWRDVAGYDERSHLGGQAKSWTKEELDDYKASRKKKGHNPGFKKVKQKLKKVIDLLKRSEEEDEQQQP